jgi:hypothetical protein
LELWGAPDIDAARVLRTMQQLAPEWLLGCRLREISVRTDLPQARRQALSRPSSTPDDPTYDHAKFRPWRLQALAFKAIRHLWPDYPLWRGLSV